MSFIYSSLSRYISQLSSVFSWAVKPPARRRCTAAMAASDVWRCFISRTFSCLEALNGDGGVLGAGVVGSFQERMGVELCSYLHLLYSIYDIVYYILCYCDTVSYCIQIEGWKPTWFWFGLQLCVSIFDNTWQDQIWFAIRSVSCSTHRHCHAVFAWTRGQHNLQGMWLSSSKSSFWLSLVDIVTGACGHHLVSKPIEYEFAHCSLSVEKKAKKVQ